MSLLSWSRGCLVNGYGDSLKEDLIQHVMPQNQSEKAKDKEITKKTMIQLLLEQFDSHGSYIGNDSDTEESAESADEED